MATRADVVRATGPWDTGFIVDYNDVDFCLRVLECGYRVVYTPYAELYHFEGSTCIRRSANLADVERFQTKWQKYIMRDPYYNPNLTKHGLEFAADPAAWGSNLNPQVSILV
jgi:GT2 family glycosyltransferase